MYIYLIVAGQSKSKVYYTISQSGEVEFVPTKRQAKIFYTRQSCQRELDDLNQDHGIKNTLLLQQLDHLKIEKTGMYAARI